MADDAPRWRPLYTGPRLITDRDKVFADLDDILAQHPRLLVRHYAARRRRITGGSPERPRALRSARQRHQIRIRS